MGPRSFERIQNFDARELEVTAVAGDDPQVVLERRRGDLSVSRAKMNKPEIILRREPKILDFE